MIVNAVILVVAAAILYFGTAFMAYLGEPSAVWFHCTLIEGIGLCPLHND